MSNYGQMYRNMCVTLQRYATEKITALTADHPGIGYFDWDTASEAHELPDHDLLGPSGLAFTDEGKIFQAVFSFGVSTCNDPHLFRLREIASEIFQDFQPEASIPIYHATTGEIVSWMQVTPPVSITPIQRAVSRPLIFITGAALVDPSAPSRP